MRPSRLFSATVTAVLAATALATTSQTATPSEILRVSEADDVVAYHPVRVPGAVARPDVLATTPVALPEGIEPLRVQYGGVAGRSALEPTLGVQSDDTVFYAASPMAVDLGFAWGGGETEVMRSDDGGASWESVQLTVADQKPVPPINMDPMVYVDEATDRVFNLDLYVGCSNVNFSDDDGDTWFTNPAACGDYVNDHQTIIAGPRPLGATTAPTSPTDEVVTYADGDGRPRWLYYCFNRVIDADCGRSVDGGLTWTPTAAPAFHGYDPNLGLCGGLHGHIDTDPDGNLLLPKGHCGRPWLGWSPDGGDSWTRVQVSDIPSAGPHLSVAADEAGNWYFLWWDARDRLPWLSVSRDQGTTWEDPMMIAPPGVREVNFPVIDAGSEGRLAITFPGTTVGDRGNAQRPWHHYMVVTTDALAEQPLFQSVRANAEDDPIHRGTCNGRCGGLWDFQDVVVSPAGQAWGAAADDCADSCDVGTSNTALHAGQARMLRQVGGPPLRVEAEDDCHEAPAPPGDDTTVIICESVLYQDVSWP